MIQDFTILSVSLFLLILFLRRRLDIHIKVTAHRKWCKENLEGKRRVLKELFPTNNETHHIT